MILGYHTAKDLYLSMVNSNGLRLSILDGMYLLYYYILYINYFFLRADIILKKNWGGKQPRLLPTAYVLTTHLYSR